MRTLVNKIFSKYLEYRMEANRHFMASPHDAQQRVLMELVEAHADTEWGRLHRFDQINSPADYARQVPVQTYGSLQPYIERMMRGEVDVLYTGFTGVRREYRGRGIAMALKLRAVDYAKSHGYREIRTWNSTLNAPMLGINVRLGFVKQPVWITFGKDLTHEGPA